MENTSVKHENQAPGKQKIGEILVKSGLINNSQLKQVLKRQTQVGGHLGSILIEMGFITIDDLLQQGQDLLKGLRILGEYKYPLEVRRGSRKEVKDMDNVPKEKSRMLKAGKKTYFFAIKETKEGKP